MVLKDDELNRWEQWRAHRDTFQSAKAGPAGNSNESFIDRPLARAVKYLDKELSGKR